MDILGRSMEVLVDTQTVHQLLELLLKKEKYFSFILLLRRCWS